MKTIRDEFSRKRKRLFLGVLGAFVCYAIGMSAAGTSKWFLILGLEGLFTALALVLCLVFVVRCPSCGGSLGYALSWPFKWDYSVSEKIKFCQFCGVSLDKEIEA